MKKVRRFEITRSHPVYKHGMYISNENSDCYELKSDDWPDNQVWGSITDGEIGVGIKEGWLVEKFEKKFTEEDMISFPLYCMRDGFKGVPFGVILEKYKEEHNIY